MTKYESRLKQMNQAYDYSMQLKFEDLLSFLSKIQNSPLIIIGSGGSLSVANLISILHTRYTGQISKHISPLEFISAKISSSSSVILVTASGRNADIIKSLKEAVYREHQNILVICAKEKSPILTIARKYSKVTTFNFPVTVKNDGFLAVNSMVIFSILVIRAYLQLFDKKTLLPDKMDELIYKGKSFNEFVENYQKLMDPIVSRESIMILFGFWGQFAAIDIESKFIEAALGNIILNDFRNFGHGRHNWIAKKKSKSSIVALVDKDSRDIAKRTLKYIPEEIPKISIESTFPGPISALEFLFHIFHVVNVAGKKRNIDPSRPSVPDFGRKLYRLSVKKRKLPTLNLILKNPEITFLLRKNPFYLKEQPLVKKFWKKAYNSFIDTLLNAKFRGIIFDFDGTLCSSKERWDGIGSDISQKLITLLESDTLIGIATGRGDSIRRDLQKKLPKTVWDKIIIGYHNGGEIGYLNDNSQPDESQRINKSLKRIENEITNSPIFNDDFKIKLKPNQLSILPKPAINLTTLRIISSNFIPDNEKENVKILESSHSIDIIPIESSKVNLLKKMAGNLNSDEQILCIGDKGSNFGNDYELLNTPYSLSVNEVSSNPNNCWNLGGIGQSGKAIALYYLDSLNIKESFICFERKFNVGY
ncbi:MAG: hypothetical protein GF308_10290 [Candidatus Heimdallarchaeota archaeon]|nr:hypothetical protein [Candidatus Heimdallarchaeota archaeon]